MIYLKLIWNLPGANELKVMLERGIILQETFAQLQQHVQKFVAIIPLQFGW